MPNLNNILFIDSESNPITKEPECLQWLIGDSYGIIEDFTDKEYYKIRELWSRADAVVMFNAPYDMGVLSIMFRKNSYKWKVTQHGSITTEKTAAWNMGLFGNRYSVRKISFFRNMIKPMLHSAEQTKSLNIKSSAEVVKMLKQGRISVDEAMKILRLIDKQVQVEGAEIKLDLKKDAAKLGDD